MLEINAGSGVEQRLELLLEAYRCAWEDPKDLDKREIFARRLAEFNFFLVTSLSTEMGMTTRQIYTDRFFRETLKSLVLGSEN